MKDHLRNLVINIAETLRPNCYLELGCREGEIINLVNKFSKVSIGVDIVNIVKYSPLNFTFHHLSTDAFFKQVDSGGISIPSLDLVFIDADHDYKQVRKDFFNTARYLSPYGVILLHDVFPFKIKNTSLNTCGTVYQLAMELRQSDFFEIFCFPMFPGLGLVRKATPLFKD